MAEQTLRTTKIENYHLLKLLTYGSVAEILLATKGNKISSKKFYIIKKLFDHIATNDEKLQAFVRECEIATSLSHENIVNGHEYGAIKLGGITTYYLAMDYVFGKNLAQVIQKLQDNTLPLPINVVCNIIHSIAKGLIHAHNYCDPLTLEEQVIIHKDISPDNIIISYNGEVKLSDFGISRKGLIDTLPGKIAGKWNYMSPEQKMGKEADCRSDIYSLGVVFWECLTGKRLFNTINKPGINNKMVLPDIVPPCEIKTNTPISISDICMQCLKFNPEDRFQSAQGLCSTLSNSLDVNKCYPTDVKKFLAQHFTEEIKYESIMLLNMQKKYSTTETHSNIEKKHVDFLCNNDQKALVLPPERAPLKYAKAADQNITNTMTCFDASDMNNTHLPRNTLSSEKTLLEDLEQTKVIEKTSLNFISQNLVQITEPSLCLPEKLQQNFNLNVSVHSSDVTQTDYEMTEVVS